MAIQRSICWPVNGPWDKSNVLYKMQKGDRMELLIGSVVLAVIGWYLYKSGKRTGSRQGYNVGRRRGRNHARHRRRG